MSEQRKPESGDSTQAGKMGMGIAGAAAGAWMGRKR